MATHRRKRFCDRLDAHVFFAENTQRKLSFAFLLHRVGHDVVRVPEA